jgi:[glutamine synthetase] adenylyltransferase / [glutamine synthetase]-adenylyl-L-tyrosine phosphorylase
MGLTCTLDLRSRLAKRSPGLDALCAAVTRVITELGFDFSEKAANEAKAV